MNKPESLTAEGERLEQQRTGGADWRLWGPYLAERAWGTVREDYSADGTAWEYFSHDQARSRAYRWNEDGLGGLCDLQQRLCFALCLWNGRDPILKERAFGLTGNQGNHGEDVKEVYFYLDATPSHSFLRYLYKYPQGAYPYGRLVEENQRRGRGEPPFQLLDTGVFDEDRYFDVELTYAKAAPDCIHIRIEAHNRGPEAATLHLLPTLWLRNTWSWGMEEGARPRLRETAPPRGAAWAVAVEHPELGTYRLYGRQAGEPLYTENETNTQRLWGVPNATPWVKDAFHRRVIEGETGAVNPERHGSKFACWQQSEIAPGAAAVCDLVLSAAPMTTPFQRHAAVLEARRAEADAHYAALLPGATPADAAVFRQAQAGLLWSQQYYHYRVARWLDGDALPPPTARRNGRNRSWRHLEAADVILMPDTWEYPWFAAWDLAFHATAVALSDVDLAKAQLELLLSERYLHPNGQIPAYEWAFSDVNPPLHAMGVLSVFRAERALRGSDDAAFLERVFHKLLLNYAWWINRKDAEGHNVFEGGFLGLDNISVFDRSRPLPAGHALKQADATGWMAMFALNLTVMALELAVRDAAYEDIAVQIFRQFLAIANAVAGHADGIGLWDEQDGFFKDLLVTPDGQRHHIDVYSWVGLIPLFACEVVERRLIEQLPRFRALLREHKGGLFDGHYICACPEWENERGERLLSLADHTMLPRIVQRLMRAEEFLSPHGIRSVSRIHAGRRELGCLPGVGQALIDYVPGESTSGLFGGNSNWRGPVWLPTNFLLIQALEKFHRFLGDGFTVTVPELAPQPLHLGRIADVLAERLLGLYRPDGSGRIPAYPAASPLQHDPHWQGRHQFYEYFHGDSGEGLGACHQTGWTALLCNLLARHRPAQPATQGGDERQEARHAA